MAARRRAGGLVADGFFQGLSRLGRLHPNASPARHGLEVERDVEYLPGGGPDHLLDVYRPVKWEGPLPALLYLHGGGFRILSKDSHWVMSLAFAPRGLVVFTANYRLAPRPLYPAAHQSACASLAWVPDNAAASRADPGQLLIPRAPALPHLTPPPPLPSSFPPPLPSPAPYPSSFCRRMAHDASFSLLLPAGSSPLAVAADPRTDRSDRADRRLRDVPQTPALVR